MLSRAFSATLNNCLDRETGEIMSEQQPEPQAMTSDEAIKTLRRYLPPHLLQEVLAALSTDEVKAYQAMETALQLLTGQILNLRTELLVIKAEVTKEVPGE